LDAKRALGRGQGMMENEGTEPALTLDASFPNSSYEREIYEKIESSETQLKL